MKQAIGSFSHRNKFIKHRTTAIGQLTSQRIPQVCWRLQGGEELCTTNRREGPDTQSALANRHFGTSFCTILSNQSCRKVIDKADCTRMFQIGDRRMLVAYFRPEFVRRDLLCKAAVREERAYLCDIPEKRTAD